MSGWIEETFVNFNFQHVNKGDPLFTIYSPELLATSGSFLIDAESRIQGAEPMWEIQP